MDNRGSKSDFIKSVKEQRVNGSWCIEKYNPMHLRCTLMGFRKNLSSQNPFYIIKCQKFSTFHFSSQINPWFWTGLIDGEGSFSIIIDKSETHTLGWRIQSKFQMGLHKRDLSLLLQLQQYLGGIGSIYKNSTINKVNYSIDSKKDLLNLINHLERCPLLTQKAADFILFKQVVELMNNKAHLKMEGFNQIISIKSSMNLGLSDFLKSEFNNIIPVKKQTIKTENIPDPN